MIKILAIYEDSENKFKVFDLEKSIIKSIRLRSRYSSKERYFLITDEVLKNCKTDDEIFGLYQTLSEERKRIFFIKL